MSDKDYKPGFNVHTMTGEGQQKIEQGRCCFLLIGMASWCLLIMNKKSNVAWKPENSPKL